MTRYGLFIWKICLALCIACNPGPQGNKVAPVTNGDKTADAISLPPSLGITADADTPAALTAISTKVANAGSLATVKELLANNFVETPEQTICHWDIGSMMYSATFQGNRLVEISSSMRDGESYWVIDDPNDKMPTVGMTREDVDRRFSVKPTEWRERRCFGWTFEQPTYPPQSSIEVSVDAEQVVGIRVSWEDRPRTMKAKSWGNGRY